MSFPTIHISCPCSDANSTSRRASTSNLHSKDHPDLDFDDLSDDGEENQTFNPYSPRANFSLYPLQTLLFCEDCNQIRCPRCIQDEIVCYFCPNCLFEVPSNTVKSEGNRCTRNCYSCPICFASLSVTALGDEGTAPFILLCNHCLWSSSDIGIEFEKPTSITAQLAAKLKAFSSASSSTTPGIASPSTDSLLNTPLASSSSSYFPTSSAPLPPPDTELTPDDLFARLKAFYTQHKMASGQEEYGTSASLSRLMGMYSSSTGRIRSYGQSLTRGPSTKSKSEWTEYDHPQPITSETALITSLADLGFSGTTSLSQRLSQPTAPALLSDIRPIAALLRTKRSKRCRTCRHILYRPETKIGSIRYRIRLVAMNYIPTLNITRFDPGAVNYHNLIPLSTHQFLLTVTNPLFDPISVHLATPEKTPGKYPSTVTIFCPEFEIGANADVWDEALQSATAPGAPGSGGHRAKPRDKKSALPGQIWDRGRNWTSVIIEVTPPVIPDDGIKGEDKELLKVEDMDRVVKIPILVRSVYDTEVEREEGMPGLGGKDAGPGVKERREYAFWASLDIGRIGKREVEERRPVSLVVGAGVERTRMVEVGRERARTGVVREGGRGM